MSPRKRRVGEKLRSLYLWHRYAGLAAALLVLWLAGTGLLLNHADDLRLAQRHVQLDWLLSAYNIDAADSIQGYRVGDYWLSQAGSHVYLDAQQLTEGVLVGGVAGDFGLLVALADRLQLHTADGKLIETVTPPTPAPLVSIAPAANGFVIASDRQAFLVDANVMHFEPLDEPAVTTTRREPLPVALARRVAQDARQRTLSWERVLLDLHAGRPLGGTGVWLADMAAVLLLLLAVTGIVVWLQRAGARKRHGG